ncbi:hypothetical protein RUND412_003626 [Rhizina undulata]
MSLPPLLQLPPEILLNILRLVAASTEPHGHNALITVSQTCTHLHHAVFCSEHDSLWREPAIALGTPPPITLDQILYPGSSTIQRRLWRNVVKLNLAWSRPFPAGTPALPRLQRAARALPPQNKSGDWFGRRTIEIFAAGEGNRKRPVYRTRHTNVKDDGNTVFEVAIPRSGPGPSAKVKQITGVLDPMLGKTREINSEVKTASQWSSTPFPCSAGFVVEERNGEFRIRVVDAATAGFSRCWNLGRRRPDRFVANEGVLVACTYELPEKNPPTQNPHIPSNLVCLECVGGKKSLWKKDAEESKVLWEFDLSVKWAQLDEHYTSFPHLKNFHITKTHLVCLVTRHPTSSLAKLTGTNFLILSPETGNTLKTLKFKTKTSSTSSGNGIRAPFTTAFSHDFLLTDTFIISGGAGGGLLVWDYSSENRGPIYTLPDPLGSDATKIDSTAPQFPRTYSALTLSVDGRYVGATTSDQLWIFDMVEKKLQGAYTNGRKIDKKDYYVKNPIDEFPGGVWCWWKEWRSRRDEETGEVSWEEVESSGGVGYLTDLADKGNLMKGNRALGPLLQALLDLRYAWASVVLVALVALARWFVNDGGGDRFPYFWALATFVLASGVVVGVMT